MSFICCQEGRELLLFNPWCTCGELSNKFGAQFRVLGNAFSNAQGSHMWLWNRSPVGAPTQTLLMFLSMGYLPYKYLPDIFPKRYLPDLSLSPTPGPPPPTHLGGGGDDHHAGGGISGWTAGLRDSSPSLLYRDSCTGISKLQGQDSFSSLSGKDPRIIEVRVSWQQSACSLCTAGHFC